jgi:dTDP-4-dehydrorhamnose reductase
VPDLADGLLRLVEAGAGGIVHLTNQGRTTWHGLASYVLRRTGSPATVRAVSTADFPRPAARPPNGVLAPMGLRALGLPLLRPWEEAVDAYLLARAPSSTEVCS